jgi:hypothetical protein
VPGIGLDAVEIMIRIPYPQFDNGSTDYVYSLNVAPTQVGQPVRLHAQDFWQIELNFTSNLHWNENYWDPTYSILTESKHTIPVTKLNFIFKVNWYASDSSFIELTTVSTLQGWHNQLVSKRIVTADCSDRSLIDEYYFPHIGSVYGGYVLRNILKHAAGHERTKAIQLLHILKNSRIVPHVVDPTVIDSFADFINIFGTNPVTTLYLIDEGNFSDFGLGVLGTMITDTMNFLISKATTTKPFHKFSLVVRLPGDIYKKVNFRELGSPIKEISLDIVEISGLDECPGAMLRSEHFVLYNNFTTIVDSFLKACDYKIIDFFSYPDEEILSSFIDLMIFAKPLDFLGHEKIDSQKEYISNAIPWLINLM